MSEIITTLLPLGALIALSMWAVSRIERWTTREHLRALYRENPLAMHDYMMGSTDTLPED